MARDGIQTNDRQLACARISSQEGQDYLVPPFPPPCPPAPSRTLISPSRGGSTVGSPLPCSSSVPTRPLVSPHARFPFGMSCLPSPSLCLPPHFAFPRLRGKWLLQAAMACAANYAWVNRSSMTFLCRQVIIGHSPLGLEPSLPAAFTFLPSPSPPSPTRQSNGVRKTTARFMPSRC